MMRKDVKLGFAIGGVLLAVVVVYVLVGTGGGEKNPGTAGIVTEDPSSTASAKPNSNITTSTPTPPRENGGSNGVTDVLAGNTKNPANPNTTTTPPPTTGPSVATNEQPKRDANGDLWGKALDEGKLTPLMVSQTPSPNANANKPSVNPAPQPTPTEQPRGTPAPIEPQSNGDDTTKDPKPSGPDRYPLAPINTDGPSTRPARVDADPSSGTVDRSRDSRTPHADGATTHTIQKGETLALISQAAYGSPNFYPHILRANPGLVPEKLKPGMVINLPLASTVHPSASNDPNRPQSASMSSPASSSAAATIDARTQYRVESGDSLYRIAQKLYGKPEMADKIYDLNKEAIGADRAKLKLHAVLKLPEPPTATASTATSGAR